MAKRQKTTGRIGGTCAVCGRPGRDAVEVVFVVGGAVAVQPNADRLRRLTLFAETVLALDKLYEENDALLHGLAQIAREALGQEEGGSQDGG